MSPWGRWRVEGEINIYTDASSPGQSTYPATSGVHGVVKFDWAHNLQVYCLAASSSSSPIGLREEKSAAAHSSTVVATVCIAMQEWQLTNKPDV